ncbi:hypothetical protein CHU98_g408 [Xylaria longipes]|nr:hypothetical protein CHU98_g408 [Xylaria longipes]
MGFPKFWGRPTATSSAGRDSSSDLEIIHDGDLTYTVATAHNGSGVAYQEAVGAPVENRSPLGYHVGWATVTFLNINQMIGTGIFSTPGTILGSTGSIGLALIYWVIGIFLAIAGFAVYLELASYFPNRSGAEVVYLEQAYPRPKHFFPISFAFYSVVLSFSSSNAIVKPQQIGKSKITGVIAHNRYSLWAMNIIGILKILTLIFITGFVILGGHVSRVADPGANFRNAFEGTTRNGNDLSVALINIIFAYSGYANAFSVVNEIQNPIPVLKRNGTISVSIVAILYLLCNIAYFSAVPKEEFAQSKATAASDFFAAVFGQGRAQDALNALVLISAFGNLLAVLIGQSRLIREIGRQGVLPFTEFFVSTKPFGTPIGPYFIKWIVTLIFIAAPPAVVSLKTYPDGVFYTAMAIGLWIIRYRHKRLNRERPAFKAWDVCLVFFLLVQIYTIATPWIPPKGGPYAGEAVVGIGVIVLCAIYYVIWMYILPKSGGYQLRPEILNVGNQGANTHRLVKVPLGEVDEWDSEHDEAGRLRRRNEYGTEIGSLEK